MSEKQFWINVGGEAHKLEPDTCNVAMFRDEPDKDYLDVWEETEKGEQHVFVFHKREMLLWMGGVAISAEDHRILHLTERENGSFREHSGGWNPNVYIEDRANEFETELFIKSLLKDLDATPGFPVDLLE